MMVQTKTQPIPLHINHIVDISYVQFWITQFCNCPSYKTSFVYFICSVFGLPNYHQHSQQPLLDLSAEMAYRLFKGIRSLIFITPRFACHLLNKILLLKMEESRVNPKEGIK